MHKEAPIRKGLRDISISASADKNIKKEKTIVIETEMCLENAEK